MNNIKKLLQKQVMKKYVVYYDADGYMYNTDIAESWRKL